MRRALLLAALLAPALLVVSSCDWRRIVLESELAPGVRDEIVRECCDCLAHGEVVLEEDACGGDRPAEEDAESSPSPCLCGLEGEACFEALSTGEVVMVVGGCTASGGPCEAACDGVLAYPQ